jgi:hypothetical protein
MARAVAIATAAALATSTAIPLGQYSFQRTVGQQPLQLRHCDYQVSAVAATGRPITFGVRRSGADSAPR